MSRAPSALVKGRGVDFSVRRERTLLLRIRQCLDRSGKSRVKHAPDPVAALCAMSRRTKENARKARHHRSRQRLGKLARVSGLAPLTAPDGMTFVLVSPPSNQSPAHHHL
ncbi:hypothetical protein [Acetobacter sp. DsW_063]|uniref:hypothetical protein n=1 Tax=Acetobacter sp. DsW_063 TaxID=1514894 RepID=UPI001177A425|nr:hypothetical protein [Acetobacter sp. DsW_063]